LVGNEYFDDAGVVRFIGDTGIVTTVDYFTPVVDDPFEFGRIAAANALSDIYAMGATPISALNIIGFPEKKLPLEVMVDILKGGAEICNLAKMPIVGGHSIKSDEPFFGLAVTGQVDVTKMMTNSGSKPGDLLYLTKPLGSGLITTAAKNNKVDGEIVKKALVIMAALNKDASEAARIAEVVAATDVTGYGFMGHLMELMVASNTSAIVDYSAVPLMDGVNELAAIGIFPGGSSANFFYVDQSAQWDDTLSFEQKKILCDAQTSGGLIISVKKNKSAELESALIARGLPVWRVGEVVERKSWLVKVTKS
jgi:selenide, water dikinase